MIAIIDTDALLGLANPNDGLHERAKIVLDGLEKQGFETLISPTTLCEFEVIATIRLGKEQTRQAIKQIIRTAYSIVSLPDQWGVDALNLYMGTTSKEESLFDCYVMEVAGRYNADCIFSFDKGYKKHGWKLAEDYLVGIKE